MLVLSISNNLFWYSNEVKSSIKIHLHNTEELLNHWIDESYARGRLVMK